MTKQDYSNRIVLILTIGVVTIIGAIVIGEMYISHSRGTDISAEVWTLLKMSITGIIGIISGYIGGRSTEKLIQSEKEREDGSTED